jgi:Antitoxin Phd_YefM, type II toxin-antitoxin system
MTSLAQIEKLARNPRKRPATDVKKRWREIVKEAKQYGEVIVTNYNDPEVIVLSPEQYVKMKNEAKANDPLEKVWADLDRELAVLKEPGTSEKLREIFRATPQEIADAANRKR